ncbi:TonB-dependent receptor, partial [hydrothermal vent metagenome]
YTTSFPLQAEHTQTTFTKLSAEFGNDDLNYSAKAYWRNNKDKFVLDKTDPEFYKNNHMTNIYGGELDFYFSSSLGKTSLGGEYVYDKIESNNLGNHNRDRKGIFLEHQFNKISDFIISLSGFVYNYSTIGWKLWPGLEVGYKLSESLNLFANVGKAFRIPTFTELYYNDPITKGNPDLQYEETLNYEIGINYLSDFFQFSSSLFRREGRNLIDYVRQGEDSPWQAMNFSSVNTNGIEFSISSDLQNIFSDQPFSRVSLKYSYLNSDKVNSDYSSRYLLQYLKHQAILTIGHDFFGGINFNWFMRYEERENVGNHFITDLKVDRTISYVNIYIKATNLFNVPYNDIAGIPLPGRWIVGGVKLSIQ